MGSITRKEDGEASSASKKAGSGGGGGDSGGASSREQEGERWVVEAVDGERHDFQTGDTIRWVTKRNETERNGTTALWWLSLETVV